MFQKSIAFSTLAPLNVWHNRQYTICRSPPRTVYQQSTTTRMSLSRREYLSRTLNLAQCLASLTATALVSRTFEAEAAPPPKQTVINSVLSAYGLPTISDKRGFSLLSAQYGKLVVQFEHPSAWVVTRIARETTGTDTNMDGAKPLQGRASGLTASDYRRAEGVAFFVYPLDSKPSATTVRDVSASFIAEVVTPGDATGSSPEVQVTKDVVSQEDNGITFRTIDTVYESTTVSGYTIERKARTKATVLKDGKLYALNASCSANRWKKLIDDFDTSLKSFRVFVL